MTYTNLDVEIWPKLKGNMAPYIYFDDYFLVIDVGSRKLLLPTLT